MRTLRRGGGVAGLGDDLERALVVVAVRDRVGDRSRTASGGEALRDLPRVAEGFAAGRLSYSKVRAVTRFVTADTEADVVMLAEHATAAHIEALGAALRRARKRRTRTTTAAGNGSSPTPTEPPWHYTDRGTCLDDDFDDFWPGDR